MGIVLLTIGAIVLGIGMMVLIYIVSEKTYYDTIRKD